MLADPQYDILREFNNNVTSFSQSLSLYLFTLVGHPTLPDQDQQAKNDAGSNGVTALAEGKKHDEITPMRDKLSPLQRVICLVRVSEISGFRLSCREASHGFVDDTML